ncbi:MAG: hypothetical protein NVV82_11550 [Sporocytophaga sp.]|nr:hypothetical protein [Sporocytophaga sp.]
MEQNPIVSDLGNTTGCKSCGAILKFAPGTNALQCEYCGTVNEIVISNDAEEILELDFNAHADLDLNLQGESHQISSVKCTGCGAESTLKPNVTADECAFCGTALVLKNAHIKTVLKPKSVLPFKIDKKQAYKDFGKWLGALWFAPNDLKKYAVSEKLDGIYLPYWTFDTNTQTDYTGQQGIDRYETEYYNTIENGKTVTKTRTRVVTDWYYAAGSVANSFDDVLINASHSLPRDYVEVLEPWDLDGLMPFNENYLAGFKSESYQVGLKDGFELAKRKIKGTIEDTIRRDIGGNHQRIHSTDTVYSNITFKHTLLPLWISSFRYRGKSYRFLINARTGETKGDRPYSWMKIAGTVVSGIATLGCFALDITTGIVALAIFLILLFKVFK